MNEATVSAQTTRAYQAVCAFCSWTLFDSLDEEALAKLVDQRGLFLEPPFSTLAPTEAQAMHDTLEQAADDEGLHALAHDLHLDRTYLFYMTGQSRTSPYESVYRTDDATMFGPTTLEVREDYRAYGFEYEQQATEPDDHIGLELSFLARLMDKASSALESAEEEAGGAAGDSAHSENEGRVEAEAVLADTAAFLSNHVLVFAPLYCKNVQARAQTPFYRSLAAITAAVISSMAMMLGSTPSDSVDEARFRLD